MANNVTVELLAQPVPGQTIWFGVENIATGFVYAWKKVFIPGTPILVGQVQIGATVADTLENLKNNYIAHHSVANVSYVIIGTKSHIIFTIPGNYQITIYSEPNSDVLIEADTFPDVVIPPLTLDPIVLNDLSIEIIDTYENELPLILEFTEANSPTITWDSGDGIFQSFQTSKLTFNLLVGDGADGKFLHLFTGDEKRYLVKLSNVIDESTTQLLWQGYILPDEYKEPWKGGAFFVEFTAVDMLGTLKGKYLPKWYYKNRFPVGKLLSYLLEFTGLNQKIIVAPSLMPINPMHNFYEINVPLEHYATDKKLADCYTILKDFLEAMGLTIYNFRGYWFLQGISRKSEPVLNDCEVFSATGEFEEICIINKKIVPFLMENSVNISSVPPIQKVNFDFSLKGENNAFSINAVNKNYFSTKYIGGEFKFKATPYEQIYRTGYFKPWPKTGLQGNWLPLSNEIIELGQLYWFLSDVNEALALQNYYTLPETPTVKAGIKYVFNIESVFEIHSYDDDINNQINNGNWDSIFSWQILMDGVEVYAHRPSFAYNDVYKREIEDILTGSNITFSIDKEISFENSGELEFRLLIPIHNWNNDNYVRKFKVTKLVLKAKEEDGAVENFVAKREINFTTSEDVSTSFISTSNESIKNNFGIGLPILNEYFYTIDSSSDPAFFLGTHTLSNGAEKEITLKTFFVDTATFNRLFEDGISNNIFLEKTTGESVEFYSWYGHRLGSANRMGYLVSYEEGCVVPANYKTYPIPEDAAGVLKYMLVLYQNEDLELREQWYIYGYPLAVSTFTKSLVNMYFNTSYETYFMMESTSLGLIFPDELIEFEYLGIDRYFIPTKVSLSLFEGKTNLVSSEAKYQPLTDIIYE